MLKLINTILFKRLGTLLIALSAISFSTYGATYYSVSGSANWNSLSSWKVGPSMTNATTLPTENDEVVIVTGSTVNIPSNYTTAKAKSLIVQGTATLFISNGAKLTVYGSVIVNNSGTLSLDSNGNDAGFLAVYGNYTNQGTTNIGKGNIIVALDYTDSNVTIQNLGNLVVGGNFIATVNVNGGPSIYIINDPTPTISITPAPTGGSTGYTNTVPPTESAELISIITTLISDPSCNISITGPNVTTNACEEQNSTFTVVPSPSATYNYRWQISTGGEFTDLADISPTLTLSGVTSAMSNNKYRCKVTRTSGTSCTKTSAYSTLTVSPPVTVGVTITATPVSDCEGQPITFSISNLINGGTPSYQWLVNTVPKATTANYTYNPVNGDKVQLKVTSNVTCATNPATSNTINMVIYAVPGPNPIVAN